MPRIARIMLILVTLSVLFIFIEQGLFKQFSDSNWVADFVEQGGVKAIVLLMLMGMVFTSFGGPRQVVAFVFGFAFGGLQGAVMATFTALGGCIIAFYVARLTVSDFLRKRFPTKLRKLESLIAQQTFLKVLMIRILPIGSNLLTNLLAGTTQVRASIFFLGSFTGFWPQMLIFSFAGAGVGLSDQHSLLISGSLFLVSCLIAVYLYRNHINAPVKAKL